MRRPPRWSVVFLLLALAAAGCANTSAAEHALLDRVDAEIERRYRGLPDIGVLDDDLSDEDFAEDEPWLTDDAAAGTEREGERPEIDQIRCPFDRAMVTAARCGKIELPGRGVDPEFTVELAFVRFSATGDVDEVQPDPVIYLHGGPGGAILETADYWYDSIVAPHIRHRDVILYDQRGSGRSSALPRCFETAAASDPFYVAHAAHAAFADGFLAALIACADRLDERADVDLTAFSSRTNAQDLADLVWALGIGEYNLHGSSYGTRLAQTVMRDAPHGVRSVVLSGSYPVDVNLMGSVPLSLESSLDAVFAGCAASARCAEALPDPWTTLEDLVRSLDADPLPVEAPVTVTDSVTLAFDGTDFLNGVHSLLYTGFHAATLPDLLVDWVDGDHRRIERLARNSVFDHSEIAVFVTVQCADEGDFTDETHLARPLEHEFLRATDLAPSLLGIDAISICEAWHSETTDPLENEPVVWEVPTLLLSGALDPITPPAWASLLDDRLPHSRLVHFAGHAHDSDEGGCAQDLIADFISNPDLRLDTSCAITDVMVVDERAERFREPLSLVDRVHDFDDDGQPVEFRGPDWTPEATEDAQILWRALDQLDPTALILLAPRSDYDALGHLAFHGVIPEWDHEQTSRTPAGWQRDVIDTSSGLLIRYRNSSSRVSLILLIEPGEPEDLEALVLIPTAKSIGSAS